MPLVYVAAWTLKKLGRYKMIGRTENNHLIPYLERFYLFRTKRFAIFIHRFWAGDRDHFTHDHPFNFGNLILTKGYYEIMLRDKDSAYDDIVCIRRKPGYCKPKRLATEFHRVLLKPGTEGKVWTIFWRWKKYRKWGFFTDRGWVDSETYLNYAEVE